MTAAEALAQLDQEAKVVEVIAHRIAQGDFPDHYAEELERSSRRIGAIRCLRRLA
jgi:hypothetical protein